MGNNIKKFDDFVNESLCYQIGAGIIATIASITVLGWTYAGVKDLLIPHLRYLKRKMADKKHAKKIEKILKKVEDDEELTDLLEQFKKVVNNSDFGVESDFDEKEWLDGLKKIPLSKQIEDRLKKLLSKEDFNEYVKICDEIGGVCKKMDK